MTLSERADELEEQMMNELNERIATKSVLFSMGDGKIDDRKRCGAAGQASRQVFPDGRRSAPAENARQADAGRFLQARFASTNHLLQSATHALKAGLDEKTILACLLHDIGVVSFIRCDHGYWGAQLIEPYVDEEVSWAIRVHQALRFFPDESVGLQVSGHVHQACSAPDYRARALYRRGVRARPEPQVVHDRAADLRQRHLFVRSRTPRSISTTSSTSSAATSSSRRKAWASTTAPSAHMWRTLMWPTRFL